MNLTLRHLMSGATTVLLLVAAAGTHAQTYINTTVGGQLAPGVYGRIDIGNAPPPPLIYAEPIIIHRPAVMVPPRTRSSVLSVPFCSSSPTSSTFRLRVPLKGIP